MAAPSQRGADVARRRATGIARACWAVALVALATSMPAAAAPAADALAIRGVDTSDWPRVTMSVTLPGSMLEGGGEPSFAVLEGGRRARGVEAAPARKDAAPPSVLLVIDTSGSMGGVPLRDAKAAAERFVDSMHEDARVAVLSFADSPSVASPFSGDRARLRRAIGGLAASGETALYDALVQAAALSPVGAGRTSVVLLSDGGDTASSASFERAMSALKGAGVPLYAVALESEEYDPKALELMARRTGGRFLPVARSDELAGLFEAIAAEISNVWKVSYVSDDPQTKDVEVDVSARIGQRSAGAAVAFPNPRFSSRDAVGTVLFSEVRSDPLRLAGFVAFAFLSVSLLAVGALMVLVREPNAMDQLRFYDQLHAEQAEAAGVTDNVRARVVDAVGYVAGRRGLLPLVSAKLEAGGLPLRPAEYISAHVVAVIGLGMLTALLTGNFALAVIVVLLTTFVPIQLLDSAADRRRSRFEQQLPDVLAMIAGSLRGGWGVQQSVSLVAHEAPDPSATEFRRVETETRLGMPLERSLDALAERMDSDEFRSVVAAIAIQREVGGNLAEVLDSVGATIRERAALRRQVRALTAEGRISAYILVALPFVVIAILLVLNPSYLAPLVTTVSGAAVLLVTVVLLAIGSYWLYRVSRIEV